MTFKNLLYILCGSSKSKTKTHEELSTYAIRQKRNLIDGTGTYYVYVIDIQT